MANRSRSAAFRSKWKRLGSDAWQHKDWPAYIAEPVEEGDPNAGWMVRRIDGHFEWGPYGTLRAAHYCVEHLEARDAHSEADEDHEEWLTEMAEDVR